MVGVAGFGTLAVLATFVVRGREIGWELSAETIYLLYVRIASLVALVVVAFGLADLLGAWLLTVPLPGGYTTVRSPSPAVDVIRGVTLALFGGAFWVLHVLLPRPAAPGAGLLDLAFLVVGTLTFGIATIVSLPGGLAAEIQSRTSSLGVRTEPLGAGLTALVFWAAHLWRLRGRMGGGGRGRGGSASGGNGPPPHPVGVGAPLVRPPDTRAAGALAIPPEDR